MNRKKREQLILNAAIQVFHREGYDKTSVSQIIDEAGVARGTFYLYFKSKKDVLALLLNRLFTDVITGLKAFEGEGTKREKASPVVAALTRDALLIQLLLFASHTIDEEFQAQIKQFEDEVVKRIASWLEAGVQNGIYRPLKPLVTARCFLGSVKETLVSWVRGETPEMEPVIEALIDQFSYSIHQPEVLLEALAEKTLSLPENFH
ncbi:TetR/AcrR family transcriptional regulator [bacterium]|nr:TetR/AcrR family transcriptional regulator [bacterium]